MKLAELLKKRWYIFLAAGIVLIASIILIIALAMNSTKKLSVAFYNVEEDIIKYLEPEIEKAWPKEVEFTVLSTDDSFSVEKAGKYDAVITWSGKEARILAKNAAEMPATIYGGMPTSVQKAGLSGDKKVFLPLLYDYSPLFYSKSSLNRGFDEVTDLVSLDAMAQKAIDEYGFSIYTAGSNYDHFYGFMSSLCESIAGAEGYKKLCGFISSGKELGEYIDEKLTEIGGEDITFRTILEYIIRLQDSKSLSGQWHAYSTNDLFLLMSEDMIYTTSMPLSYYRTIPMRVAANYKPIRFPLGMDNVEHSFVAQTLVMFVGKKTAKKQDFLKALVSSSVQERLSESTMLIPVSSQAGCYDIYADDGRFYAASSFGGLISPINKECFTTADEEAAFKDALVNYITYRKY
ncbi:MAG: hypothetical protein J6Y69_07990 [Treponema sp.]|nr:hypothetical protein [Treponema sp.]